MKLCSPFHILKFCLILLLAGVFSNISQAQAPPTNPGTNQSGQINTTRQDTTSAGKKGFFTVFYGNPGKAALYSLILPGAGQLYNGRWWKLPFVYGLEGAAIYFYLQNSRNFNQFNFCYESLIADSSSPPVECQGLSTVSDAYRVRNSYRNNKEISLLLIIGAHLLQTLEAFIDRHLIDFDIDEDLSYFQSHHDVYSPELRLLHIKIPLEKKKQIGISREFSW